jgi:glucose-6-phosphate 1-epimerase
MFAARDPFVPDAGAGGLPKVTLGAVDGARADVYRHGAHVTSWIPAGEADDRLFVSARSQFAAGAPIRGGIPVCFPQFAAQGALPMHGFARTCNWDLVTAHRTGTGSALATFRLEDSELTRTLWPHAFAAEVQVTVAGGTLEIALSIENTGREPLEFTAALHTYLRVADVRQAAVHGLSHIRYFDKNLRRDCEGESDDELRITAAIDRIYFAAPERIEVREPARSIAIRAAGFPDTVVWNPGPETTAALADLEPGGYARMLCVEAAAARTPIVLSSGDHWRGAQTLVAR